MTNHNNDSEHDGEVAEHLAHAGRKIAAIAHLFESHGQKERADHQHQRHQKHIVKAIAGRAMQCPVQRLALCQRHLNNNSPSTSQYCRLCFVLLYLAIIELDDSFIFVSDDKWSNGQIPTSLSGRFIQPSEVFFNYIR